MQTKNERIVLVTEFTHDRSMFSSNAIDKNSVKISFKNEQNYFLTPYDGSSKDEEVFFHFPILLNNDGTAWNEGNLYLLSIAMHNDFDYTPAKIARKASQLIDYKIWSEKNSIDVFDFSALRPKNRPTYRYFTYLHNLGISAGNLNQRTSLIYKFTKHFKQKFNIDTKRIDQVTDAFIHFKNKQGHVITAKVKKRKLTEKINKSPKPLISMVMDEGEPLRPLIEAEQAILIHALSHARYNNDERLIFNVAIDTGIRKQTILTLRLKHINNLTKENLLQDGSYRVSAGPGTGIDTKFNKPLTISIPAPLAEKLKMYAYSKFAQQRRTLFRKKFGDIFGEKDDIYLFLSSRGDCRYMAKDDPRYLKTKVPPSGGSIQSIIKKLYKFELPNNFPKNYKFHWNRASFALNYYLFLKPLVDNRIITYQDQIAFIQDALSHESPEITENYLKLFTDSKKLIEMQSHWENKFFSRSTFDSYLEGKG
jgi:integrase